MVKRYSTVGISRRLSSAMKTVRMESEERHRRCTGVSGARHSKKYVSYAVLGLIPRRTKRTSTDLARWCRRRTRARWMDTLTRWVVLETHRSSKRGSKNGLIIQMRRRENSRQCTSIRAPLATSRRYKSSKGPERERWNGLVQRLRKGSFRNIQARPLARAKSNSDHDQVSPTRSSTSTFLETINTDRSMRRSQELRACETYFVGRRR